MHRYYNTRALVQEDTTRSKCGLANFQQQKSRIYFPANTTKISVGSQARGMSGLGLGIASKAAVFRGSRFAIFLLIHHRKHASRPNQIPRSRCFYPTKIILETLQQRRLPRVRNLEKQNCEHLKLSTCWVCVDPKNKTKRKEDVSRSTIPPPPQRFLNEIAGFETTAPGRTSCNIRRPLPPRRRCSKAHCKNKKIYGEALISYQPPSCRRTAMKRSIKKSLVLGGRAIVESAMCAANKSSTFPLNRFWESRASLTHNHPSFFTCFFSLLEVFFLRFVNPLPF